MAAARAGQIRTGHDQAGRSAPAEANPDEAQSFDEAKHARDRRCSNTVKRVINPRHTQGRSVHGSTVLNQSHACNVSSEGSRASMRARLACRLLNDARLLHGEANMNSIGSVIGRGMLVAGLLIPAGSALAAGSDDGFAAFWTQFNAAVGKSDQKAVSEMIKYPVLYHDMRQAADFPLIWKGAFKPAQRTCLARQKPVMDKHEGEVSYSAFCGSLIYVFGKDGSGWKLTDFGEND